MRNNPGPGTAEVSRLVVRRRSAPLTGPLTAPLTGALRPLQMFAGGGERLLLQGPAESNNSNNCPAESNNSNNCPAESNNSNICPAESNNTINCRENLYMFVPFSRKSYIGFQKVLLTYGGNILL